MSHYENDPATKALATHCLVCGRPLRDATSVELGIGPICRANLGEEHTMLGNEAANRQVHIAAVAAREKDYDGFASAVEKLWELGFRTVAAIATERFPDYFGLIVIRKEEDHLYVSAPYNRQARWRSIPTAVWNSEEKHWMIEDTPNNRACLSAVVYSAYRTLKVIGEELPREQPDKPEDEITDEEIARAMCGMDQAEREAAFNSAMSANRKLIMVERRGQQIRVKTPYNKDALDDWRALPGSYEKSEKCRYVPATHARQLHSLLERHYQDHWGIGPKGLFHLEEVSV